MLDYLSVPDWGTAKSGVIMSADYLIIGGGLVGLATARALLLKRPGACLTLLEKESACGLHQSTHNSGVLHCGLYYRPGSLKARLAVEGIRAMTAYCRAKEIPHDICGKIVLATNSKEQARLHQLEKRGRANGLTGLRPLGPAEIREREPAARGVEALLVPEEGIVDYAAVVQSLTDEIQVQGGHVQCNAKAWRMVQEGNEWIVETPSGVFRGRCLINAAGLYSDKIARLAGVEPPTRIVPFRGEYYRLKPSARIPLRHLIYPVPDPAFPFLGVHFTRLIDGGFEAGPSAVLAWAREGYRRRDINLRESVEALTFPGLWRFIARYPRMCATELAMSLWPPLFIKALQRLVPEIRRADLEPGGTGVRAQAMERTGSLQQDFSLVQTPTALHVLNAPSPAATAALAIGQYIAGLICPMRSWPKLSPL